MLTKTLLPLILGTLLSAQSTWNLTGRVHPELKWTTLETAHFRIHYHQGLEETARQGASIAEQVWPTLLKQMELDTIPTIDIIFTTEDEIMNGFALWTNTTFIWVDQNDAALWLEDEKWLFQVIAHELQHIVFFNTTRTWLGEPWGILFSQIPLWVVEGLAEYETERWRPHRADLSHKWHVMQNKLDEMNPHHDGYSKLLYWSDRFGDSTIVQTLQHRNKLKLFNFKKAFKEATGIPLKQFEEDWRRHMNTYYYGYRSQKEAIEEVGTPVSLPVKNMQAFRFYRDSSKIALVGQDDEDQSDQSLYIAIRDTAAESKARKKAVTWWEKLFRTKADTTAKKPPPVIWDLEEVDHGAFHSGLSWSPDGKQLVYAKYHFDRHQSLVYDLRILDTETKQGRWITDSFRALHPDWSPDSERIVFVAHRNNVSNLYTITPQGSNREALTNYSQDIQLLNPRWSPEGDRIVFAKAGPDGNLDLYLKSLETAGEVRLTTAPEADYRPVWHPAGSRITYTSHRGSTPNLYTLDLETGESIQNSDVGEAVWSQQWTPGDTTILATTLGDVDTVRLVKIDPNRRVTTQPLNLREAYTRWRSTTPAHILEGIDPSLPAEIHTAHKYRFYQHPKHLYSLILPVNTGIFGLTAWTDPMGRHILQVMAYSGWSFQEPAYMVQYFNAQHGPLWGINLFRNFWFNYRFYDHSPTGLREVFDGLWEVFDGWQFWVQHPLNFGLHLSSAHLLSASLALRERRVLASLADWEAPISELKREGELPQPESGREGLLTLAYQWVSRRPHKKLFSLPDNGWGLSLTADLADSSFYGLFSYQRLTWDSFTNLPLGPLTLFLRGKAIALEGDPPAQEYVGLSRDPAIYLPGPLGTGGLTENLNPRGWDDIRLGDRVVFGTAELRLPLIPRLPLNAFGFTLGSLTGALVSDFGNAWWSGQERAAWVSTAGYEIKVALEIGRSPLLIFALGQAQTVAEWQEQEKPLSYARLALINPF